jgi:hypothetical protein
VTASQDLLARWDSWVAETEGVTPEPGQAYSDLLQRLAGFDTVEPIRRLNRARYALARGVFRKPREGA